MLLPGQFQDVALAKMLVKRQRDVILVEVTGHT